MPGVEGEILNLLFVGEFVWGISSPDYIVGSPYSTKISFPFSDGFGLFSLVLLRT